MVTYRLDRCLIYIIVICVICSRKFYKIKMYYNCVLA